MAQAQRGDTVHVHYTGKLDDGTVFDSSRDTDPIEFTIGAGQIIPGFEDAIVGMSAGDEKTERIEAERAYGERSDDLVFHVEKDQMPEDEEIEVGDLLRIGFPDGSTAEVQVAEIADDKVTLDANHPLAGKTLTFDLQLMSIA
jgi:peptidylprolyl isomerase